eukprot:4470855-Ditylum_brightwellii.AAC.1
MEKIIYYNDIDSPSKLYNTDSPGIIPLDCLYYDPKKERSIEENFQWTKSVGHTGREGYIH